MSLASGRRALALATVCLPAGLVACSPALDWREVRPEGSGVTALFPCRPDKHERSVGIAGASLRMQLHSCDAAGATFSLAVVDGAETGGVERLLVALKEGAAANIAGRAALGEPFAPPGATPNPASALLHVQGRLPDGRPITLHGAFFVHGVRIYQAAAIGAAIPEETLRGFFGAIKLTP